MDGIKLMTAKEMGEPYKRLASSIRNRNRVVITGNDGKSESVIISIADYEAMKEAAWERYVNTALDVVKAVKDDPTTWLDLDEFFMD